MDDPRIVKIQTLPSFGGARHTTVTFNNNSAICSCGVGFTKIAINAGPNLRLNPEPNSTED